MKLDCRHENIAGRAGQRTSDKNEIAGDLRARGSRIGRNPVCVRARLVGEDSHKLDKQSREDKDKRARPNEERAAEAQVTAEANGVVHGIKNWKQ